jgi:hypothetical protein
MERLPDETSMCLEKGELVIQVYYENGKAFMSVEYYPDTEDLDAEGQFIFTRLELPDHVR